MTRVKNGEGRVNVGICIRPSQKDWIDKNRIDLSKVVQAWLDDMIITYTEIKYKINTLKGRKKK